MGKKSHSGNHKDLKEKVDKRRPKSKHDKKIEQHEHKAKKKAKAEDAKKGYE